MADVGLFAKDVFYNREDGFSLDHLVSAPKLVPDRTLLLHHDPPLSIVLASRAISEISAHSQKVTSRALLGEHLPSPVFLIRRAGADSFSCQLLAQPLGQVLSEATCIDEVFPNLRHVEAIRLKQNVEACHVDAY